MKIVAIIQARMGSTRLPGKILKEVLGKPLLEYQLDRVRKSNLIDQIVIATTTKDTEQPIIDLCEDLSIDYYRGSEDDVLSRYYGAALKYEADLVVRLTSDCPIIDPQVIDSIISQFSKLENYDYVSNTLDRFFPRGMDTEVFSFKVLENCYKEAKSQASREHVTPHIYKNPEKFRTANVVYKRNVSDNRWTVDTEDDFRLISKIIEELYPAKENFTLEDVLTLIDKNVEWKKINQHIEQKKIGL